MWNQILNKLFWGVLRHFLSDRQYARIRYRLIHGLYPDIENPTRLSEKIQFIKLYERTEQRQRVADRIRVREFVKERAGGNSLIPQMKVFHSLDENIWNKLPDQFVLKASHGSGFIRIIRNKDEESVLDVIREVNCWLATDYYSLGREWVYKGMDRYLIAEELLLDDNGKIPSDYKFYCFAGEVALIQVDLNRFEGQQRFLFDPAFEPLDARLYYPPGDRMPKKPDALEEAVQLAEILSEPFNFIRVDLFILNGKVWFGEMTNYPANGFQRFEPESVELELGRKLKLDKKS